ncbi:hypothetical protein FACS1894176_03860 [Bacteroidia bacterium]|nr:hypothetical protein FACS1894176_03860 [Bacteroidia bacterium]
MTSCELFGLELQQKYDYDAEKGLYDNQLSEKTAWEFITTHTSLFSQLIEAVEYAEVDPEVFNQPNLTLLLVSNAGLTTATDSYWARNKLDLDGDGIPETTPMSWDVFPKEQVRDLILYHIVKGAWSYNELTAATAGVLTFFPTESTRSDGYVALQMKREGALSIYFNNFENHYTLNLKARTNNLQLPNGSYIHVMDKYLNYPTDLDLANYSFYNK